MIQLTATTKIHLAIAPLDFRKGIDGICATIGRQFELDPMNGAIFVFRNRRGTQIKMLSYDGSGFWLCMKRLSQGVFWWPKHQNDDLSPIDSKKMMILLWGANPETSGLRADWKKIS